MHYKIGFSPCPNDTFIFDALVNQKIDTAGLIFEPVIEDVETLNQLSLRKTLPITKLSFGVLPLVLENYILLNHGSALGKGVGPLLVGNKILSASDVNQSVVAIPGEYTTAHVLFSLAYPEVVKKVFMRYDEIENFVLDNRGLGVIIHENRFTYEAKGLFKIQDLGEYWQDRTNSAIPLGGIVIDRSIPLNIQKQIDSLIKASIEYAYANYTDLPLFVKEHAKEMDVDIMRKHIELYVNNFSLELGEEGRQAIEVFINVFNKVNNRDIITLPFFINS